jgi:hypothetical protein
MVISSGSTRRTSRHQRQQATMRWILFQSMAAARGGGTRQGAGRGICSYRNAAR